MGQHFSSFSPLFKLDCPSLPHSDRHAPEHDSQPEPQPEPQTEPLATGLARGPSLLDSQPQPEAKVGPEVESPRASVTSDVDRELSLVTVLFRI